MKLPPLLALALAAILPGSAEPPRAFVDASLSAEACHTYDPASRRCGAGRDRAFRNLAGAAAFATVPGTLVLIREGTYKEALVPAASGTPSQPTTYGAYQNETAIITGPLDPAIDLSGRSHIVLDGLTVRGTTGWLRAVGSRGVVIRRCRFSDARGRGSRGGMTFVSVAESVVRENVIDGGHDNLLLVNSNRNIVEQNLIANGRDAAWAVLCGGENVIKGNWFVNTLGKIGEISDCDGTIEDVARRDNAAQRNLVEANLFFYTPPEGAGAPFAGLQYSGQSGLIRGNAFAVTSGPALRLSLDAETARFTTANRVYHNVFLRTAYAALELPGEGPSAFHDNIFKNNILYGSVFKARGGSQPSARLNGKPVQVLGGRRDGFVMERNVIFGAAPGERDVIVLDGPDTAAPAKGTLAWWQQQRPSPFVGNLEIRPVFRDELRYDVRLAAESVLLDEGAFLTRVSADGSGTRLPVEDASWFFDGFGLAGVAADEIQLEGDLRVVRVVRVDRAGKALELDGALSWRRGQGLSLKYIGKAPDVGLPDGYEPPRERPQWQRELTGPATRR